jgi:hypothetical protein
VRPRRRQRTPVSHRIFYILALLVVLAMILGLFAPLVLTSSAR